MKAREAELKAAGYEMSNGEEPGESIMEEMGESDMQETGEEMAEKAKDMSPDDALKMLANDFGEDFAKMLSTVIDAKVAQASSSMGQSVDEIISDIVDTKARNHFEAIAERHPDFMDVSASPDFTAYVDAMPEEGKAEAMRVIEGGTAREICKMLDVFKAATAQPAGATAADAGNDDDMDAAEGVRSTGMRLNPAQRKQGLRRSLGGICRLIDLPFLQKTAPINHGRQVLLQIRLPDGGHHLALSEQQDNDLDAQDAAALEIRLRVPPQARQCGLHTASGNSSTLLFEVFFIKEI